MVEAVCEECVKRTEAEKNIGKCTEEERGVWWVKMQRKGGICGHVIEKSVRLEERIKECTRVIL